jgi:hypothetical protein
MPQKKKDGKFRASKERKGDAEGEVHDDRTEGDDIVSPVTSSSGGSRVRQKNASRLRSSEEGYLIRDLDTGEVERGASSEDFAGRLSRRATNSPIAKSSEAFIHAASSRRMSAGSSHVLPGEFDDDEQWLLFYDYFDRLASAAAAASSTGELAEGFAEALHLEVDANDPNADSSRNTSSLLSLFTSALGELTSIAIPIGFCEPTTFMQRFAEPFANSNLLDEAAAATDPIMRIAYVATFFVAGHSGNIRVQKPLNPLLGETFELLRDAGPDGKGRLRYVAEQVSHHPPICAYHADNGSDDWKYWDEKRVDSKFNGNSLSMKPLGTRHVLLNGAEHYTHASVLATAHNLIFGSTYLDHSGPVTVVCQQTGLVADVTFEKVGWTSRNRYAVHGEIKKDGKVLATLSGKWTESMSVTVGGKTTELWHQDPMSTPDETDRYKFTPFLRDVINKVGNPLHYPPTDSRFRPDRMFLDAGLASKAGAAKTKLENKQRAAKKWRIAEGREWTPRFFERAGGEDPDEWRYRGGYWELREQRMAVATGGASVDGAAADSAPAPSGGKGKKKGGKK